MYIHIYYPIHLSLLSLLFKNTEDVDVDRWKRRKLVGNPMCVVFEYFYMRLPEIEE